MEVGIYMAFPYLAALARMATYVHVGITERLAGKPTTLLDWLSVNYRAGEGAIMVVMMGFTLVFGMELLTSILTQGGAALALSVLVGKLEVANNLLLLVLLVWVCCTDGDSLIRGD